MKKIDKLLEAYNVLKDYDIVSAWLKDYIKVDFYKDDWMEVPRNGQ